MKSNKRKTGGAYRRKKNMIRRHAKPGKKRKRANNQYIPGSGPHIDHQLNRQLNRDLAAWVKMAGLGIKE